MKKILALVSISFFMISLHAQCPDFNPDDYHLNICYTLEVEYSPSKPDLLPISYANMDTIATILLENDSLVVELSVHSNSIDAEERKYFQNSISELRARTLKDYLIKNGVNATRIFHKGYANTMPLIYKDDKIDQATQELNNRRTELILRRLK